MFAVFTKDELDWLLHGFSDVDMLNEFTGNKKFEPAFLGLSPVQYLKEMGILSKHLLVSYGNFLSEEDLKIGVKYIICTPNSFK